MAADANVFSQFLKMPPSAMDYADRFAASDMAREQNAMNRLLMQEKKQALEEQNRLKQLYMQNPGITPDELRRSGFRNEAAQMEGAALERRKTETDIGYKEAQTSKEKVETAAKSADAAYQTVTRHAQGIGAVRTPQDIVAYIDKGIALGIPEFTQEMRQKAIAQFNTPESVAEWKNAAMKGSVPIVEQYKQAAEDERAALERAFKAANPDYAILDSSTGVVGVDKRTLQAKPVTYGPAPAPVSAPPLVATPGQPSPAPAVRPGASERYISPETQKARDTDRLAILRQEWQTATNPEDKAAIGREIVRAGGTLPAATGAPASTPSAPIQVQPRQKDPGQPFAGEDADGPGMFQMVDGKPVRVPGLKPKADAGAGKISAEVQRQIGGVMDLDKTLAALQEEMKNFDPRSTDQINIAKRTKISSLAKQAQLSYKEAVALGALTGPDMKLIEGVLADPTSFTGIALGNKGILAQLEEARASNKRRVKTLSEQYGDKATAGMNSDLKGGAPANNNGWTVTEVK
jgi:hypothetical protein